LKISKGCITLYVIVGTYPGGKVREREMPRQLGGGVPVWTWEVFQGGRGGEGNCEYPGYLRRKPSPGDGLWRGDIGSYRIPQQTKGGRESDVSPKDHERGDVSGRRKATIL